MLIHLRLGDADRARLGVAEEWLRLDTESLMLTEAEILDEVGLDWDRIRGGVPVRGADGRPVVDEATGRPKHRYGPGVQRVWVWQALRRADVFPSLGDVAAEVERLRDLDFDLDALIIGVPKTVAGGGGKEAAAAEAAAWSSSVAHTPPPSGPSSE